MKKLTISGYACFLTVFSLYSDPSDYFSGTDTFKRAHIGIYITELKSKTVVFEKNSEQYFIPASMQKIPVSIAALELLGEEYRFQTDMEYAGHIDETGNLRGDLWIRGGGDPTLSLEILSDWEKALENFGIKKITGSLYIDASHFESAGASPFWMYEDLGNYYGAGASSLSIHHNLYHIILKPGEKEGDPADILQIDPPIPGLDYHNEITTGPAGSGDRAYVFGTEYSPTQYYRGTIPIDEPRFTIKAAMPDPVSFCAFLLESRFHPQNGTKVVREKTPSKILIHRHLSPPLREILHAVNAYSDNLYAEHLLKALGEGSATLGARKIESMLADWSIPSQIKDGAGLARNNLITPKGFVDLLVYLYDSPVFQAISSTFATPQGEGTLKSFPALSRASLKAKTGSMSNIYNIGGYFTMPSGKIYAFAIFCNQYQGPLKEIKAEISSFLNDVIENLDSHK